MFLVLIRDYLEEAEILIGEMEETIHQFITRALLHNYEILQIFSCKNQPTRTWAGMGDSPLSTLHQASLLVYMIPRDVIIGILQMDQVEFLDDILKSTWGIRHDGDENYVYQQGEWQIRMIEGWSKLESNNWQEIVLLCLFLLYSMRRVVFWFMYETEGRNVDLHWWPAWQR